MKSQLSKSSLSGAVISTTITFLVAGCSGGGDPPASAADTTAPTIALTAPTNGTSVSGTVILTGTASDNVGVLGVQFKLDGNNYGAEDTSSPYSVVWDSTTVANGAHMFTAVAKDAAGNSTTSIAI